MASGSNNLTTYYAKRIIGDSAASAASSALLQTGADITNDIWIISLTERLTSKYGIKYKYDANAHDSIEFYGNLLDENNQDISSAWVQLDTGDAYFMGSVGIGTDTLTYKLNVEGGLTCLNYITAASTANQSSQLLISNSNGGAVGLEFWRNQSGSWQIINTSAILKFRANWYTPQDGENARQSVYGLQSLALYSTSGAGSIPYLAIGQSTPEAVTDYRLYVTDGKIKFDIGTTDGSNSNRFIVYGNSRQLSIGAAGIQAYNSSNTASPLYLNWYGSSIEMLKNDDAATSYVYIRSSQDATDTNTGALRVDGGVGVDKDIYVGELIVFTNKTAIKHIEFTRTTTDSGPSYICYPASGQLGIGTGASYAACLAIFDTASNAAIRPGADVTYDLGSDTYRWNDIYGHHLVLAGSTNSTMTDASTNPRISFLAATDSQPVHLIYTHVDTYRGPAGLKVIGGTDATPAWFEVEGNLYIDVATARATAETSAKDRVIYWTDTNRTTLAFTRFYKYTSGETDTVVLNAHMILLYVYGNDGTGTSFALVRPSSSAANTNAYITWSGLRVRGNIYPYVNNTYDLGASSLRWQTGWYETSLIVGPYSSTAASSYNGNTSVGVAGSTLMPGHLEMTGNSNAYIDFKSANANRNTWTDFNARILNEVPGCITIYGNSKTENDTTTYATASNKSYRSHTFNMSLYVTNGCIFTNWENLSANGFTHLATTNSAGTGMMSSNLGFRILVDDTLYVKLYVSTPGTTSLAGVGRLTLGNNLASTTAKNAKGYILMYGETVDKYIVINPTDLTANLTLGATKDTFTMPKLNITSTLDSGGTTDLSGDTRPTLVIGTITDKHLEICKDEIMAKATQNTTNTLYLNNNGGMIYAGDTVKSHGHFKCDRTGYGLFLIDSASNEYAGIYDNGSNIWIGATSSTGLHHKGNLYISAGHNGTAGNKSIYISIPANGNATTTHTTYPLVYKDKAGSATKGIYTDANGKTAEMTYELKTTVNDSANATRIAYYSGKTAISGGTITTNGTYLANISYLTVNADSQTDYRLYVNGVGAFTNDVRLYIAASASYKIINSDIANLNAANNGLTANRDYGYNFYSKDGTWTGGYEQVYNYDDTHYIASRIYSRNHKTDGSNVNNYLILYSYKDGTVGYGVANQAAFRTAINAPSRTGADASGTWGINITGVSTSVSYQNNDLDFTKSNYNISANWEKNMCWFGEKSGTGIGRINFIAKTDGTNQISMQARRWNTSGTAVGAFAGITIISNRSNATTCSIDGATTISGLTTVLGIVVSRHTSIDLKSASNNVSSNTSRYYQIEDKNGYAFALFQGVALASGAVYLYIGVNNRKTDGTALGWRGISITQTKSSADVTYSISNAANFRSAISAAADNHTHGWANLTDNANSLSEGTSDWTDNTEILTSYASNNGFADTNAKGKVYRRDAVCAYNYIKSKASGSWGISITGSAGSVAWANTGHPSTFPPSSHDHTRCGVDASWLYFNNSNEVNFGGTNTSTTIYFGYRATDSRPKPTLFVFGKADSYAGITASYANLNTVTSIDGNGLLAYKPASWSWVSNSQWGVGATNCQGVIRSNNDHLIHAKNGTNYNILDASNYTSYTVKKDGTGASGTWGISITGNAAAVSWQSTADCSTANNGGTNVDRVCVWSGEKNGNGIMRLRTYIYGVDSGDNKGDVLGQFVVRNYNSSASTPGWGGWGGISIYAKKNGTFTYGVSSPTNFRSAISARVDTAPASGTWFRGTPVITSSGVMEIGRYIDFHTTNASTADYDFRMDCSSAGNMSFSGNLSISGNIYLSTAGDRSLYMKYGSTDYTVIRNHNNGNVTVNACSENLFLGYVNTKSLNFMNGKATMNSSGNFTTSGIVYANRVWANQGTGETRVGVDASTTGNLYLWSNGTNKGLYSGSGYKASTSIIKIDSSTVTFYGTLSGNATGVLGTGNVAVRTSNAGSYVQLQTTSHVLRLLADGNLVVYEGSTAKWSAGTGSSRLIKQNICTISDSEINKFMKIRPVSFTYRPEMGYENILRYGVIAEELLLVYPNLVDIPDNYSNETFDIKKGMELPLITVKYDQFIPLLIKMVQNQQKEIEELRRQISKCD